MYWSKYFIPTLKEVPTGTEAISHQLSLRAGLVQMLTSGVYSYLPLGFKVLYTGGKYYPSGNECHWLP